MGSERDAPAERPEGVISRKLEGKDLGIDGVLAAFDATLTVSNALATVRVNMIAGIICNPLSVIATLKKLARDFGATELRIEGVLANERLANVLSKRYGAISDGVFDAITLLIKPGDR